MVFPLPFIRAGAIAFITLSCIALAACERREAVEVPAAATSDPRAAEAAALARIHADAPDIAWFKGGVDEAFRAAQAANKPVLLYWGAQWCPPCKQLKSAVFNRPDFIEKSKLFVAVYLDGDLPDAQKWGDVFRVTGYPTVLVLRPDRAEITRVAGNMDLSLYARVLDDALGDMSPLADVLERAVRAEAPLGAADCRRLAYHAFGLDDEGIFEPARLQVAFENAARLCPPELAKERTRFLLLAAAEAAGLQKDVLERGGKADRALTMLILRVNESSRDRELTLANADALRGLPKEFYLAVRQTVPQISAELRERVMAVADAATASDKFAPADQLAAQLIKIRLAKAYAPDGATPTDVRTVALQSAEKMLAAQHEPYVRAGIVNSAINIYIALDDWPRARDLLAQEAKTSNTPHYYLGDLADVEEKLGNESRSLELLAEAYAKAKGPASRFQWGYQYLDGLLRLAPEDTATIEKVGLQVIGELDGPNRVHRRTLSRIQRLDKRLREWKTTPARGAVVERFRGALLGACEKSPGSSTVSDACREFGGARPATAA